MILFLHRFLLLTTLKVKLLWRFRTMIVLGILSVLFLWDGAWLLLCFLKRLLRFLASLRDRAIFCLCFHHRWTLFGFTSWDKAPFRCIFLQEKVTLGVLLILVKSSSGGVALEGIVARTRVISGSAGHRSSLRTALFRAFRVLSFWILFSKIMKQNLLCFWLRESWCISVSISGSLTLLSHLSNFVFVCKLILYHVLRCLSTWCARFQILRNSGWLFTFGNHFHCLLFDKITLDLEFL